MRYNIGDKVTIISDLKVGMGIDGGDVSFCVIEDMLCYAGKTTEIIDVEEDGTYLLAIDNGEWYWHKSTFKQPSNADKIRVMSDEELAIFLNECECAGYRDSSITPKDKYGYSMDILEWLQSDIDR